MTAEYRNWHYKKLGDYHRNLDLNWSYAPTYLSKLRHVDRFMETLSPSAKILDLACGEGVLVEKYRDKQRDIVGLDFNYASKHVIRGDARHTPFPDMHFDAILFLDALEHFQFSDQDQVLAEIYRILKPTGTLFLAVPNLAHLESRTSLLFGGELGRTDSELEHVGERPFGENRKLIEQAGFAIEDSAGITLTLPLIYKHVICKHAEKSLWLHDALEYLAAIVPSLAMLNCFTCKKKYFIDHPSLTARFSHAIPDFPIQGKQKGRAGTTELERLSVFDQLTRLKETPTFLAVTDSTVNDASLISQVVHHKHGKSFVTGGSNNNHDARLTPVELQALPGACKEINILLIDMQDIHAVEQSMHDVLPALAEDCLFIARGYGKNDRAREFVNKHILPVTDRIGSVVGNLFIGRINRKAQSSVIQASVVIPTYHRPALLEDALNSILKQDTGFSYEILVMDNACDDQLQQKLDTLTKDSDIDVRYIPVEALGLHNCRNQALFQAQGELVVFVDDDVITPADWLENILSPFSEPRVCMVAGRSLPRWEIEKPHWVNAISPSYYSLLNLGDEGREMQLPEAPYGCNMAVRRQEAIALLGFAPDSVGTDMFEWKRGDGETGFARKVYKNNMAIHYTPSGYLYHRIPAQRMTKSYLYKRTIKSAISGFYSEMRQNRYNRKQLLVFAMRNGYQSLLVYLKSILAFSDHDAALLARIRAMNLLTRAIYQARLVVDKDLRDWVKQEHYLFEHNG